MLLVEDEPYMAEAIRDGLRLETIAADDKASGAGYRIDRQPHTEREGGDHG